MITATLDAVASKENKPEYPLHAAGSAVSCYLQNGKEPRPRGIRSASQAVGSTAAPRGSTAPVQHCNRVATLQATE